LKPKEDKDQKKIEPKKVEDKKPQAKQPEQPKETPKVVHNEAPKSLMQVQSSQDSEFEKEFIDVDEDNEDDDNSKAPKKSEIT
jgi:hypothetical protein